MEENKLEIPDTLTLADINKSLTKLCRGIKKIGSENNKKNGHTLTSKTSAYINDNNTVNACIIVKEEISIIVKEDEVEEKKVNEVVVDEQEIEIDLIG